MCSNSALNSIDLPKKAKYYGKVILTGSYSQLKDDTEKAMRQRRKTLESELGKC